MTDYSAPTKALSERPVIPTEPVPELPSVRPERRRQLSIGTVSSRLLAVEL